MLKAGGVQQRWLLQSRVMDNDGAWRLSAAQPLILRSLGTLSAFIPYLHSVFESMQMIRLVSNRCLVAPDGEHLMDGDGTKRASAQPVWVA